MTPFIALLVWCAIGFFGSLFLAYKHYKFITVSDLVAAFLGGILGPLAIAIILVLFYGHRVVFRKKWQ